MLPPSYTKAVLADYHQKLAAKILSLNIRQLSPGSLRDACAEIRRKRFKREDELPLMAYFGEGSDEKACLRAIETLEIDKFRSLGNFLKGKTQNPDDKVVELAAWLIDFSGRPYDPRKDYSNSQEPSQAPSIKTVIEVAGENVAEIETGPQPTSPGSDEDDTYTISPASGKNDPPPNSSTFEIKGEKRKKIILTITITIVLGMIITWIWLYKPTRPNIEGLSCMFWSGDHYQPIDCRKKVDNTQVITLDTALLYHFKKINQPDTITINAIGYVWYARYRGNYEFYTGDGPHPTDPTLRLRPITAGIVLHHTPSIP